MADPYQVYRAADVVLMCSKFEAMGRTTAEAMATCRPVIGNNQGATPELIEHGHTGLLYQGDSESLAAQMLTLSKAQLKQHRWAKTDGSLLETGLVSSFIPKICMKSFKLLLKAIREEY